MVDVTVTLDGFGSLRFWVLVACVGLLGRVGFGFVILFTLRWLCGVACRYFGICVFLLLVSSGVCISMFVF